MNMNWQDLAAIAIVLLAAAYLARLTLSAILHKPESSCGSACARCSASSGGKAASHEPIHSIGPLPPAR